MNLNLAQEVWHWQDIENREVVARVSGPRPHGSGLIWRGYHPAANPTMLLRIDNPLVSGHHARIFCKTTKYISKTMKASMAPTQYNRSIARAPEDRRYRRHRQTPNRISR